MKKIQILLASLILLISLGSGCAKTNDKQNTDTHQTKSADTKTDKQENKNNIADNQIFLKGQATLEGSVKLNWEANENLQKKVESWRLLHSKKTNPTYPSTWWYERGPSHMEKEWSGLPKGNAHIRVCAVINNVCEIYSNDLEIDIK